MKKVLIIMCLALLLMPAVLMANDERFECSTSFNTYSVQPAGNGKENPCGNYARVDFLRDGTVNINTDWSLHGSNCYNAVVATPNEDKTVHTMAPEVREARIYRIHPNGRWEMLDIFPNDGSLNRVVSADEADGDGSG